MRTPLPPAVVRPTHRCKVCGALWRLWEPSPELTAAGQPDGSWSVLTPNSMRSCCDSGNMDEVTEPLSLEVWEKLSVFYAREGGGT